ncbi:QueT transporter family protein [Peribacillus sp. NPDC097675]|uniref:QueT transporter family protein n=1 Tax=Peribacillus sp. NPDC097675 TaxID=3390618 RepID=UPI003D032536
MNIRTLAINGLLAAIYIAVSFVFQPIMFGVLQFRIPEMLNHLIIFNKKYIYGIVVGVFISNLFFSQLGAYDLIFGVGQSLIALLLVIFSSRFITGIKGRMAMTIFVFTLTMFLIAMELNIVLGVPFLWTWAITATGEFLVLLVGAPIIYIMNKRIHFGKLL